MPSWSLTAEIAEEDAEDVAALLVDAGATGVEERRAGVAPMPGARRAVPGRAILVAWFGDAAAAGRADRDLGLGGEIAEVADRDWGERWKEGLSAFAVGRVFVRPSWIEARPPPGAAEVVLDPGMAFGTGTHPTTALCLAALGDLVAARRGLSVLDVGTGSGLLAIAAARLGAGRVVGVDDDPTAVRVARENAARNRAPVEVTGSALGAIPGPFDLVVANILANTLVELAPAIARQVGPGGTLLLSGLVAGQEEEVRRAYASRGLVSGEDRGEGEWRLLVLRREP